MFEIMLNIRLHFMKYFIFIQDVSKDSTFLKQDIRNYWHFMKK